MKAHTRLVKMCQVFLPLDDALVLGNQIASWHEAEIVRARNETHLTTLKDVYMFTDGMSKESLECLSERIKHLEGKQE